MRDGIGIVGLLCVIAGIGMLSKPLALILAGAALVLFALLTPEKRKTDN